jgi:hypothetical protein
LCFIPFLLTFYISFNAFLFPLSFSFFKISFK